MANRNTPSNPEDGFAHLPPLPTNLLTWRELDQKTWANLRVRMNPSKLCGLRAKGMPSVKVSRRRFRYQYEAVARWLFIQASRSNSSAATEAFNNLNARVSPFTPRPKLRRASGGEA